MQKVGDGCAYSTTASSGNALGCRVLSFVKISECKGRQDLYIGALNARLKELEEDILRRLGNVPKNCVISHRD